MQSLKPKKLDLKRPEIVRNAGLRAKVWARDQGICSVCGRFDSKWIHEHVRPLWMQGPDTLENSETHCRRHATEKTSKEATARAKADRLAQRHALTQQRKPTLRRLRPQP